MTLERSVTNSGQVCPVQSHLSEWQAFSFETGHFLLHIPSSHVLEVPSALAAQVRGEIDDPEVARELTALALALPRPVKKRVELDIRAISLNLAQGCNLRCTYCFAGEGDYGSKGMMSLDTAKAAISLLAQGKSSFHVVFFGGEPMLNWPVIEAVVNWCESEHLPVTFSMTTNGTLLTAEKLAWLKSKKFALNLSYDGPGIHAKQRLTKDKTSNTESMIERKIAAFSSQLDQLREFRLRSTITKATLPLIEESLVATLNSKNFKLFLSHHATNERGVEFEQQDVEFLGDVIRKIVDRYLATGEYSRLLNFENIAQVVKMIHRGKTGGMACGAGVSYLTVSAVGRFYLCHRFNEDESECVGDITNGLDLSKLEAVASFRSAGKDPCKSCWMREWCAGGCMHEHKSASGDKFAVDPRFCKLQSIEMVEAMRVYTTILARAPELLESM